MMNTQIKLGDMVVEVALKDIKNVHLSVHPPAGKVRISAPLHMPLDTIHAFASSKLPWIRQQRERHREQERETPREYLGGEGHYAWGERYPLAVIESDQAPSVELADSRMLLRVRPGTDDKRKQALVYGWYRQEIRKAVPPLIAKWEPGMGVKVERFFVQRMKTRWGSCSVGTKGLRFNSELAKKPRECLEYVVVHEMAHLLERTHNRRFEALMDRFMPEWRIHRAALNRLPLRHESWG